MTIPSKIRLAPLERYFVLPETEDVHGLYYPMNIVYGLILKQPIPKATLIAGVKQIACEFPQLRLGYTLDYINNTLRCVPNDRREAFLEAVVVEGADAPLDALVTEALSTNITPFAQPFQIAIHGHKVVFKGQHSLFDGRTFQWIVTLVLLAATGGDIQKFRGKISPLYFVPLWQIVWRTPAEGFRTTARWLIQLSSTIRRHQGHHETEGGGGRVVQAVTRSVVSNRAMAQLNRIREKIAADHPNEAVISLNTLISVLIGRHFVLRGLVEMPVTHELQLDLRGYLPQKEFVAGSLSTRMVIEGLANPVSLDTDCLDVQRKIQKFITDRTALVSLFSRWVTMLFGTKFDQRMTRQQITHPHYKGCIEWTISNHGQLKTLEPIRTLLDLPDGLMIASSEVSPRVVSIRFGTLGPQGYFTIIYDAATVAPDIPQEIFAVFSEESLERVLAEWMPILPEAQPA
jgi:hypothetical protein